MRDIIKYKSDKFNAKAEKATLFFLHDNKELHSTGSTFGKCMFLGMSLSVLAYLFFVSSSIFYAINTQKYSYEIQNLNNFALEIKQDNIFYSKEESEYIFDIKKNKKERITYLNRNADTSISLR